MKNIIKLFTVFFITAFAVQAHSATCRDCSSFQAGSGKREYCDEINKAAEENNIPCEEALKAFAEMEDNIKERNPQMIKELRDNARSMTQQDALSRGITGLSTAAIGLGGAQLGQGISESLADRRAMDAMEDHLKGFKCGISNSADGRRVSIIDPHDISLTEQITVPPDSDTAFHNLEALRGQYLVLAAQIKSDKEMLGIAPGIESEVQLDTSMLYQNQATMTGAPQQPRLSMAMLDAGSSDARAINAQQQQARTRMIAGGSVAAVGLAGSLIGHGLMNSRGKPERSAEIKAKYAGVITASDDLQKEMDKLRKENEQLQAQHSQQTEVLNQMKNCKNWNHNDNKCDDGLPESQPQQPLQNNSVANIPRSNTGRVTDNFGVMGSGFNLGSVPMIGASRGNNSNMFQSLVTNPNAQTIAEVDIPAPITSDENLFANYEKAVNSFATGKDRLSKDFENAIQKYAQKLATHDPEVGCIVIIGQTDWTGNYDKNVDLSKRRAEYVRKIFVDAFKGKSTEIISNGAGPDMCESEGNQPSCRTVSIDLYSGRCSSEG